MSGFSPPSMCGHSDLVGRIKRKGIENCGGYVEDLGETLLSRCPTGVGVGGVTGKEEAQIFFSPCFLHCV
jgi:hypothetical protein